MQFTSAFDFIAGIEEEGGKEILTPLKAKAVILIDDGQNFRRTLGITELENFITGRQGN